MAERKKAFLIGTVILQFSLDLSATQAQLYAILLSAFPSSVYAVVVNNKHNVNPHRHNFLHSSTDIRHAYPHLPNSHLLTRALIAHQGQPHAKLILHYHMSYHKYRGQQSICCGNTLPRVPTIQRLMPTPAAIKICILFDLTLQMSKFTK